jgi:hypothetical protein
MKVVVCGSRYWPDENAVAERMHKLPAGSEVIHGGARGVDTMAGHWAGLHGHRVRTFRANWDKFGKGAGFIRNHLMLDEGPDLVIAFQVNGSRGTQHTIDSARRRGIPVEIHRHETNEEGAPQ